MEETRKEAEKNERGKEEEEEASRREEKHGCSRKVTHGFLLANIFFRIVFSPPAKTGMVTALHSVPNRVPF